MKPIVGSENPGERRAEFGRGTTVPKHAHWQTDPARLGTRPIDAVAAPCGDLWMINHSGSTVLRCNCLEASSAAVRLRAPTGYGVAIGQQYELCSHVAGARRSSRIGGVVSSRVTVRRIEQFADQHVDWLDIIATLDPVS